MLVELKHRTLYLLEEMPPGKLATSLIKMIASKDDMRGRQLHQHMQTIEIQGKLLCNANTVPDLGEEGPVWDRVVFVPFDTRYVVPGQPVDLSNYRLPSDNARKNSLIKLTDAFATVCLQALNRLLVAQPNLTDLPLPRCIQKTIAAEKERAFPLKMFVKEYTVELAPTKQSTLSTTNFFHAYRAFLRHRNIRCNESLDDVVAKLIRVGLSTFEKHNTQYVKGRALTDTAASMADRELERMESMASSSINPFTLAAAAGSKRSRDQLEGAPQGGLQRPTIHYN